MALFSLLVLVLSALSLASADPISQSLANDLTVLNYALTLENLESTFYAEGLALFTATDFGNDQFNESTYDMLQTIAGHEAQHVATLTVVINSAAPGNQAVKACQYNFTAAFASPAAFVAYALALETGGQQAYDGALNGITNPAYAAAAATIATVEARHAAYLNLIQNPAMIPFPDPFDTASTPLTIAGIVSQFILSCPYNITLPTVRPTGVELDSTKAVVATGSLAPSYTAAQQANDLVALNYALTLENLEASFYNYALALFPNELAFTSAGHPAYYYTYSTLIQSHENTHVTALGAVITARGGTPVPACNYDFSSITTVDDYLAVARVLENTGVMAYDGAANTITDTGLQQVAATIVTVEARHAAFLNLANALSPFPTDFDNATLPSDIISRVLATGFILNCSYTPVGPVVITPALLSTPTSVLGDPSFIGFHGQSFQVHGIPARYFNLLSTCRLQLNALFTMLVDGQSLSAGEMAALRVSRALQARKSRSAGVVYPLPLTTAYSHSGTFLSSMALKWRADDGRVVRVGAVAGAYVDGFSSVTVDGEAVAVSDVAVEVAAGMYITRHTPSTLTIDTHHVSFTLVNADRFFNLEQATLHTPYTADSVIDGLLGQTADETWKVEGNREWKQHMVLDYLLADLDSFSDDFVSNVFGTCKTEQEQQQ